MKTNTKILMWMLSILWIQSQVQAQPVTAITYAAGALTTTPAGAKELREDASGKMAFDLSPRGQTAMVIQGQSLVIPENSTSGKVELIPLPAPKYRVEFKGKDLGTITISGPKINLQMGTASGLEFKIVDISGAEPPVAEGEKAQQAIDVSKLCPICDAIDIAGASDPAAKAKEILKKYPFGEPLKNRFLPNEWFEARAAIANSSNGEGPSAIANGSFAGGAGIISEGAILNGLTNFIVQRFKDELNAWFLKGFREKLDAVPGLKKLIPKTYLVLKSADPYQYPVFLQSLREAFQGDLSQIQDNFLDLLADENELKKVLEKLFPNNADLCNEISEAAKYVVTASHFANSIHAGMNLRDALLELPGYYRGENVTVKSSLELGRMFAIALNDGQGGWVNMNQVGKLYQPGREDNAQGLWYLWGLLYQMDPHLLSDIKINSKTLEDRLYNNPEAVGVYFNAFAELAQKGIATYKEGKALAQEFESEDKVPLEKFDPFVLSCLDVVAECVDFLQVLQGTENEALCACQRKYLPAARLVWEATQAAHQKGYGLALTNVVSAFDVLTDPSLAGCDLNKTSNDTKRAEWIQDVLKYGNFMVTIVNAQSSEEVQNALEAAALPVGSYSIKRNNRFTIGLNAWVAPSYGRELRLQSNGKYANEPSVSLMAPVGFSFSLGPQADKSDASQTSKKGWHPSAFILVSVLDIGSLVNFRLTDSTTADIPNLTFKNFLAPGLHIGFNPFQHAPVSIGAYCQYGPWAREATQNGVVVTSADRPSLRLGGWIGIDISIFNFYVHPGGRGK